jgi:hypothetical protein
MRLGAYVTLAFSANADLFCAALRSIVGFAFGAIMRNHFVHAGTTLVAPTAQHQIITATIYNNPIPGSRFVLLLYFES